MKTLVLLDNWDLELIDTISKEGGDLLLLWLGKELFQVQWEEVLNQRSILRVGLGRDQSWKLQYRFLDDYVKFIASWPKEPRYRGKSFLDLFEIDGFSLWWLTEPAEKNNYLHPTINYIFQLLVAREIIKEYEPSHIIIRVREERFYRVLVSLAESFDIKIVSSYNDFIDREIGILYYLKKRITHMVRNLASLPIHRRILKKITDKAIFDKEIKKVGFFSWFPHTWLVKEDNPKERMYGTLPEYIESKKGYETFFLTLFDISEPIFWRLKEIMSEKLDYLKRIVPILAFVRFRDILMSFLDLRYIFCYILLERMPGHVGSFHFKGIDIYPLLRNDFRMSFIGPHLPREIVSYIGVRNFLRSQGKGLLGFFYYLEFQKWERGLAMAFSLSKKREKLIGFQHSTISPMSTNYYLDPSEILKLNEEYSNTGSYLPMPSLIILSGEKSRFIFEGSGFKEGYLRILGSPRYQQKRSTYSDIDNPIIERKVLFPTSFDKEDSIGALKAVIPVCRKNVFSLVVKSHPLNDMEKELFEIADSMEFSDITLDNRPVTDLLKETNLVVTTWTTVTLEGLIAGRPTINISYCDSLDLSLFMGEKDISGLFFASDAHELADKMEYVFKEDPRVKDEDKERLLSLYFSENDDINGSYLELIEEINGMRE